MKFVKEISKISNSAYSDYLRLKARFKGLEIPYTKISSPTLSVACEIFEKLNTGGTKLGVVDIMVAKTFNKDFNLRNKINDFNEALPKGFYVGEKTILQAFAAKKFKEISSSSIIDSADTVRTNWSEMSETIKNAIDFVSDNCGVKTSDVLPNEVMLVPLSYFFLKHKATPGTYQKDHLSRWFWLSGAYQRYVQGQSTVAKKDIEQFALLLDSKEPAFEREVELTPESIKKQKLTLSSALCSTILCMFHKNRPRRFEDGAESASTISRYNAKELHHIFPKKYLEDEGYPSSEINSVANICLLPAYTNKKILKSPPSEYLSEYEKSNKSFSETLRSHFIEYTKDFGILDDNFEKFLNRRSRLLYDELERLITTGQLSK